MLIRRTRKFRGYTDINGYRTPDAPKNWPFGMVPVRQSKAKPKNRSHHHYEEALL